MLQSVKKILFLSIFMNFFITVSQNTTQHKSIWKTLLGNELKSSVTFLPVGTHTRNVDLIGVYYTSFNYKSYEISAFRNSFKDLTFIVSYKRAIHLTNRFSLIYGVGIMHGYKGRLQNTKGVPFRKSFLFTGNLNPTAGIELDYKISKKTSIHINLASLVFVYGFRVLL